jgi:hypothetical protein
MLNLFTYRPLNPKFYGSGCGCFTYSLGVLYCFRLGLNADFEELVEVLNSSELYF